MRVVANGAVVFLKYIRIAFVVFKLLGKIPDENHKLVINDIDLISAVWNNFTNLLGILGGSVIYYFLLLLLLAAFRHC